MQSPPDPVARREEKNQKQAVALAGLCLGVVVVASLIAVYWLGASARTTDSRPTPTGPTDEQLARNWPTFRGTNAGVTQAQVPGEWDGPSGRNILWKTPIALPGQSSPIVWEGSIFLSGATKERQQIYCMDANTGHLRWEREIGKPDPPRLPKIMEDTGFAAPTMATDGQRVFVIFATGDLAALDFAGNVIWSKSLGLPDNQYGYASSLVMWRDRLLIQYDQGLEPDSGKSELLALDGATGNIIWKTARPVANSWTSPIVVNTPSGAQIITAANPWVIAYAPESGRETWRARCLEGDVAPSPAYANGLVLVAMETARATAIRVGGSADVTSTHVAWTADTSLPDIVSPLLTDKLAFTATSFGTVTCYDAADGKKLWDHDFDGPFHASPILIGSVVHIIDRKGVMNRFEAGREFRELKPSPLGEPVSATPAIANDRLYIRTATNLYCIGTGK